MGSSLASAIANVALTDEEEAALVKPSNLFGSPKMWPRFHRDVKIFMEACLSHAKKRIPAQMIVTNDHKFFSMFLNSPLAEDVLHSVVTDVLQIQEGVRVKLLGELVAGM